ncbi:MAG: hypothetical protein J1G02_00565 [Clostridiales bacterium]|nr:hypothetical protein [Clostridiales bacterium]
MINIVNETFLAQYFLYASALGKYCDKVRVFNYLADLFYIPQASKDYLFKLSEDEPIKEIVTYGDAMRYSRIRQYCELNEYTLVDDDMQEMVSIKSKAIKLALSNNLAADANATQAQICKALSDTALAGNIVAMRLLGTLQCEGIFVDKQLDIGLKNLNKAGQWADLVSLLALTRYLYASNDTVALQECLNRLAATVENSNFEYLLETVEQNCGIKHTCKSQEIALLKKGVASNKVKSEAFQPMCARLIFGNAIDIKDKEKVLFSDNKAILSEVCDLPLKLSYNDLSLNLDSLQSMPLKRKQEQSDIKTKLRNSDLRQHDGYRPLCLVSESGYVLEAYLEAIVSAVSANHCERIDVADLKPYDFDPTASNVFVRSCNDDKNNVYILTLKGDVDNTAIGHVKSFLNSAKRRRFRLNTPRVTLDLSPILPICVCDEANATKLGNSVECVNLADISAEEKQDIVKVLLDKKSKLYMTKPISADKDVVDMLCNCSPNAIERALDKLFSEQRFNSKFTVITAELFKPYEKILKGNSRNAYGFGGYSK